MKKGNIDTSMIDINKFKTKILSDVVYRKDAYYKHFKVNLGKFIIGWIHLKINVFHFILGTIFQHVIICIKVIPKKKITSFIYLLK